MAADSLTPRRRRVVVVLRHKTVGRPILVKLVLVLLSHRIRTMVIHSFRLLVYCNRSLVQVCIGHSLTGYPEWLYCKPVRWKRG